jgi:hypothetical protein
MQDNKKKTIPHNEIINIEEKEEEEDRHRIELNNVCLC